MVQQEKPMRSFFLSLFRQFYSLFEKKIEQKQCIFQLKIFKYDQGDFTTNLSYNISELISLQIKAVSYFILKSFLLSSLIMKNMKHAKTESTKPGQLIVTLNVTRNVEIGVEGIKEKVVTIPKDIKKVVEVDVIIEKVFEYDSSMTQIHGEVIEEKIVEIHIQKIVEYPVTAKKVIGVPVQMSKQETVVVEKLPDMTIIQKVNQVTIQTPVLLESEKIVKVYQDQIHEVMVQRFVQKPVFVNVEGGAFPVPLDKIKKIVIEKVVPVSIEVVILTEVVVIVQRPLISQTTTEKLLIVEKE